jgi:hypothetical protein
MRIRDSFGVERCMPLNRAQGSGRGNQNYVCQLRLQTIAIGTKIHTEEKTPWLIFQKSAL